MRNLEMAQLWFNIRTPRTWNTSLLIASEPELVANFLYMLAMLSTGVAVARIIDHRTMKRFEEGWQCHTTVRERRMTDQQRVARAVRGHGYRQPQMIE